MRNKIEKFYTALLFCMGLTGLQAQEIIMVTGGNASIAAGAVSFSIGQLVYITYMGINDSIIKEVPQPYDVSVLNELKENSGITLQCSTYLNPATDFVNLKVERCNMGYTIYQFYSIIGNLLVNKKETAISMKMNEYMPVIPSLSEESSSRFTVPQIMPCHSKYPIRRIRNLKLKRHILE